MKSFPKEIERMSLENEISVYRKKSTMVKVVVLVAIFLIAVIAIARHFGIETSEALI